MADEVIQHEGKTFRKSTEGHKGKKAHQVAKILEQLQELPGVPWDFEVLCSNAGAKYPQDVVAAMMALEMCELVDIYKTASDNKTYYVFTDEPAEEESLKDIAEKWEDGNVPDEKEELDESA